jgi:hypothetical protein
MKSKKSHRYIFSLCLFLCILMPCFSHANSLDNWVPPTSPISNNHWFYGISYGIVTDPAVRFVTVGDYGTILTSQDGLAWSLQPSGDTHHLYGIGYGNGNFVAVGTVGTILTSANGIDWTRRDAHVGNTFLFGAAYGNGTYVVVGASGIVLTSPGGPNWLWTKMNTFTGEWLYSTVYNGSSVFSSVGSNGEILSSTNGISWIPQTSWTSSHLMGVAYGNGIFVAVGYDGIVLTSPNGTNWTVSRPPDPSNENLYGVAFGTIGGFGYFVAAGEYGTIITSGDGTTWTYRNSGTSKDLLAVAYDSTHSAFAVVGTFGTILLDGDSIPLDPVWIPRAHSMYRGTSLQDAYYHAFDGDTILSQALQFNESLTIDNNISVTLEGGYDSIFTTNPSQTTINGTLTITGGTVVVENLVIQ